MPTQELARVTAVEAELIRGLLDAEGFTCRVSEDSAAGHLHGAPTARVMIDPDEHEEALEILRSLPLGEEL